MIVHRTRPTRLLLTATVLLSLAGLQAGCQSTGSQGLGKFRLPGQQAANRLDKTGAGKTGGAKKGGSYLLRVAEGRNLETVGKWDDARKVYKEILRDYPDRHRAYHRLAVVADRQRRHEEAQKLYARAVRLSPPDAELFNDLGYCFYLQGKLTKAESALEKAVMLESDNSRFRNNLGMVIGQQGRYQEALKQFEATASKADAYYNLAFVYASQDKNEEATSCFRRALDLDPMHGPAQEAMLSFQQYDKRDPLVEEELAAGDVIMGSDNVAYVPYVEDTGDGASLTDTLSDADVAPASGAQTFSPNATAVQAAGQSELPMMSRQSSRFPNARLPGLLRNGAAVNQADGVAIEP
jgi:Tfp pilus assembly protein PilF